MFLPLNLRLRRMYKQGVAISQKTNKQKQKTGNQTLIHKDNINNSVAWKLEISSAHTLRLDIAAEVSRS